MLSPRYPLSSYITQILPQQSEDDSMATNCQNGGMSHRLRKRKHVDYCEIVNDLESEDDEVELTAPRKRRQTGPTRRERPFPFLSLPPEIRNKIYKLTLGDGQEEEWLVAKWRRYRRSVRCANLEERQGNFDSRYRYLASYSGGEGVHANDIDAASQPEIQRTPNLIAVCRQIFEEAGPIMYPRTFILEDMTALHHFLSAIGPCKRKFVEKIVIKGWDSGRAHKAYIHPALSLLAGLPEIKEVEFDCELPYRWNANDRQWVQSCALNIFRNGFRWLEAVDGAVDTVKLGKRIVEKESRKEQLPLFYKELKRLVNESRRAYSSRIFE